MTDYPRITFVVGAGASHELGLPLGQDLATKIGLKYTPAWSDKKLTKYIADKPTNNVISIYANHLGVSVDSLREACFEIHRGIVGAASIDNFVHSRQDDLVSNCAKVAIVREILEAEHHSSLNMGSRGYFIEQNVANSWLVPLLRSLTLGCNVAQFLKRMRRIDFVVFNYDRTIEYYLQHAASSFYGELSPNDIPLNVHHVYGVVDSLERVPFGREPIEDVVVNSASNIRTFTESESTNPDKLLDAKIAMQKAETVVFLGFAYVPMSVRLILPENSEDWTTQAQKARTVYGTTYGLPEPEISRIKSYFEWAFPQCEEQSFEDMRCVDLLQKYQSIFGNDLLHTPERAGTIRVA